MAEARYRNASKRLTTPLTRCPGMNSLISEHQAYTKEDREANPNGDNWR